MKKLLPWIAIVMGIALDQLSKWYLLDRVGIAQRPPIAPVDWFALVMVWNKGVSFGMMNRGAPAMVIGLMALAVVVSALLLRLALKSPSAMERLAYGMIIGGALSNALDRVRFGAVADFFYFHLGALGWPAFNLADAMICVGVFLLIFMLAKNPQSA